mmetsp:Transcript_2778/g.6439  ORF Transcript_2778/g.6439 Transcript_2778/m.6439 type:complete len:178 (+) Transcript_2778:532-1065(+)
MRMTSIVEGYTRAGGGSDLLMPNRAFRICDAERIPPRPPFFDVDFEFDDDDEEYIRNAAEGRQDFFAVVDFVASSAGVDFAFGAATSPKLATVEQPPSLSIGDPNLDDDELLLPVPDPADEELLEDELLDDELESRPAQNSRPSPAFANDNPGAPPLASTSSSRSSVGVSPVTTFPP